MWLCTYTCKLIKLFTTVLYWWQRKGRNFKPRIFGNFCRDYPRLLAHPVATVSQNRQFLDGLFTVVQGKFSDGFALPSIGDAFVFKFQLYCDSE